MTRSYDVDCELNYDVHAPSTFIFKIEAALLPTQAVYNELLTIVPALCRSADASTPLETARCASRRRPASSAFATRPA